MRRTTSEIRDYIGVFPTYNSAKVWRKDFDRWLAEHDRQIAENAWYEGKEAGRNRWMSEYDNDEYPPVNPHKEDR